MPHGACAEKGMGSSTERRYRVRDQIYRDSWRMNPRECQVPVYNPKQYLWRGSWLAALKRALNNYVGHHS